MGLDSAGKSTLLARLLTGQVGSPEQLDSSWLRINITVDVFQFQGDGDVTYHWIQCGKSGPGQEDISDSVGCWRPEEHETQLEVNIHRRFSSSGTSWMTVTFLFSVLTDKSKSSGTTWMTVRL